MRRAVAKEALRVVRKGGRFAFQDLFLVKSIYGEVDDLFNEMRGWGLEHIEFVDTSKSDFISRLLRLRFMLGAIALIHGTK